MERNKTGKLKATQLGNGRVTPEAWARARLTSLGGWWEESVTRDSGTDGRGGRSWRILDILSLKCPYNIHMEIF